VNLKYICLSFHKFHNVRSVLFTVYQHFWNSVQPFRFMDLNELVLMDGWMDEMLTKPLTW